ncbi:hypothetical protein H0H92_012246 [Tricholoma furcatifolium]|nr:hypothetical protein H0H92_012246 [Tricholoma furcatifolium]
MKQLRKLRIRNWGDTTIAEVLACNPFIPYTQLTHLDLGGVWFSGVGSLLLLLRSCLSVQSIQYPKVRDVVLPEDIDELLPNVTSVTVKNGLAWLPIPWVNLTNLSLPPWTTLEDVYHILEKTTLLEYLTIYAALNASPVTHQHMISLINLRTLSISSHDTCLLPYLSAPVVRKFHIKFIEDRYPEQRPRKSRALTVLDFLDQGLPLETLVLGMELGDEYVTEGRRIILPDLHTLYLSSKDKWALVHLLTPKICNLYIRLAFIDRDDRRAPANDSHALEFLKQASQFGALFIRFDRWGDLDPPTVIRLRSPLFIPKKQGWILSRLSDFYLEPDTCLPEDELRGFIARLACTPTLSIHVDEFEQCLEC